MSSISNLILSSLGHDLLDIILHHFQQLRIGVDLLLPFLRVVHVNLVLFQQFVWAYLFRLGVIFGLDPFGAHVHGGEIL